MRNWQKLLKTARFLFTVRGLLTRLWTGSILRTLSRKDAMVAVISLGRFLQKRDTFHAEQWLNEKKAVMTPRYVRLVSADA